MRVFLRGLTGAIVVMESILALYSASPYCAQISVPRRHVETKQTTGLVYDNWCPRVHRSAAQREKFHLTQNYSSSRSKESTSYGTGVQTNGHRIQTYGNGTQTSRSPMQSNVSSSRSKETTYQNQHRKQILATRPAAVSSRGDYISCLMADEGVSRWASERLPLRVYISTGGGVRRYRASFRYQFIDALNEWVKASGGKLSWRPVNTPQDADIVCGWSDRALPGGSDEAGYTETVLDEEATSRPGVMGKSKITILTQDNGHILTDTQIRKVCLHELGHALGYQGHSPFPTDIMYEADSPQQGQNLSARDIRSICNLYWNH